ncbi:MAG: putative low-complexity protein [Candidatus Azotimanducaceae bacterium]|jgi:uncharacterized low-complexity protein
MRLDWVTSSTKTKPQGKTMKLNTTRKALVLAMGTAMGVMAAPAVMADANPFSATEMPSGYMQLAEGSCGEGKCGGDKAKAKAEGSCGGDKAEAEGSCGGDKAEAEGSCGGDKAEAEGSCGGDKAEAEGSCGGDKAKTEGKCGEGKCGQ